jgi:hypothetical protein
MDAETRKTFIKELTNSVRDSLIRENRKYPNEWDGYELRWLIADTFERNVMPSGRKGKRYNEYKNTVLVNNL